MFFEQMVRLKSRKDPSLKLKRYEIVEIVDSKNMLDPKIRQITALKTTLTRAQINNENADSNTLFTISFLRTSGRSL